SWIRAAPSCGRRRCLKPSGGRENTTPPKMTQTVVGEERAMLKVKRGRDIWDRKGPVRPPSLRPFRFLQGSSNPSSRSPRRVGVGGSARLRDRALTSGLPPGGEDAPPDDAGARPLEGGDIKYRPRGGELA